MRGKGEVMIGCMEGARGEMRGGEEGTRGGSSVGQVQNEEGRRTSSLERGEMGEEEREKAGGSNATQRSIEGSRVSRKNVSSSNSARHLESESQ